MGSDPFMTGIEAKTPRFFASATVSRGSDPIKSTVPADAQPKEQVPYRSRPIDAIRFQITTYTHVDAESHSSRCHTGSRFGVHSEPRIMPYWLIPGALANECQSGT